MSDASARRQALSEVLQVLERHFRARPDEVGQQINAALALAYNELLELMRREPPARARMHRWRPVLGCLAGGDERQSITHYACDICTLERQVVAGPQGGHNHEYRRDGQVLARGPVATTKVPPCVAPITNL
jgi:hypothetical protein